MTDALLSIKDLRIGYRLADALAPAVRGVGLDVRRGECVAVVGESGSGKSSTAHALLGVLPDNAEVSGSARLGDVELIGARPRVLRAVRGRRIGFVPQDPMSALNPVQRIGDQVAEVLRIHRLADRRTARLRAIEALERAGLDRPAQRARQFPHQLSGGMRQRALIALATVADPALIVADEPTSALDVTVQRTILDRLAELSSASGAGVLLITHDLGVAAERADRLVVMRGGTVVEAGSVSDLIDRPREGYTRELLGAAPRLDTPPLVGARPEPSRPLLELRGVDVSFRLPRAAGADRTVAAVSGVDLTVERGETVGLVGESGSGKTTTARVALGLVRPDAGEASFDQTPLSGLRGEALRLLRRRIQVVQQNPYASLNPRWTLTEIISEPLAAFGIGDRAARATRVAELLDRVGLPTSYAGRLPRELSGGQRQRVSIARALAPQPDLIVCDEPVSALDVSVQARILRLLVDLQAEFGQGYLFISHDLAVVRQIAHRTAVLSAGRIVEVGPTDEVLARPRHDYTRTLLAAVPGAREPERSPA
ncbi:dipeptide ABC transporter ATP-binding protein [Naumannella huperziae]